MRNLKKILALVLALMMVLSVMVTASAAYDDAEDISYTEAVEVMSELGILLGKGDNNFDPQGELTRAEAATIITKVLLCGDLDELSSQADAIANPFTDVADTYWGVDYIKYCASEGIIVGNGDGTFAPNGKLTGYAYAKMVLLAAGIGESKDYLGTATQSWQTKVLLAAKENDILVGLEKVALSGNLTREQAAQMTLNAMKAGGSYKYTYYVVTGTENGTITTKPATYLGEFTTASDAYVTAAIMNQANGGSGYCVKTLVKYSGTLLINNFDVTYTESAHDSYGRPGCSYLFNSSYPAAYQYTFNYSETPVATFTTTTTAAGVLAELAGYGIVDSLGYGYLIADDTPADWDVTVYDAGETTLGAGVSFALISGLTGLNKVVEVYSDDYGYVDEIVVVETKFGQITDIDDANELYGIPEVYYIDGIRAGYNYAGYKVGDYVTYTNTISGAYKNVASAQGFVGTLTSYTNTGVYTVDGVAYYIDDAALAAVVNNQIGVPAVYYLGANGSIIGTAPVGASIISNYALVTEVAMAAKATDLWGTNNGYTVQVKAVLSDGTYGVYDLAVSVDYTGAYYIVVNGARVYLAGKNSTSLTAAIADTVYTYTLDGSTITLVDDVTDGTAYGTVYAAKNTVGIAYGDLSVETANGTYVVNSDTVTVMGTATPNTYTTVKGTGSINPADAVAAGDAWVVYKAVVNADKTITWVVSNIFAIEDTVATTVSGADLSNYVFVSGVYTVTKDVTYADVYTYVAYKADGSTVSIVNRGSELTAGIYVYNANTNTVVDDVNLAPVYVGTVAGDTYQLGGVYYTVTDSTKVVSVYPGAKLEKGALVYCFDNGDGLVDLIYVVYPAL